MTCESLSWNSLRQNNKRRAWVWVLSLCSILIALPVYMTVYLSRISSWNKSGAYRNESEYIVAIRGAYLDALSGNVIRLVIVALAVVIAIQGYSYLFSRRKVDLYHSVPVSMKSRFITIYVNGIILFSSSLFLGYLICILMLVVKNGLEWELLIKTLVSFLIDLFVFTGVYDLAILAVMFTGNLFMASMFSFIILFYADIWKVIINSYRDAFYQTVTNIFKSDSSGVSIWSIFSFFDGRLDNYYLPVSTLLITAGISALKLLIWAIIPIILAYKNYKKRPTEAAGGSMIFYSSRIIIKLLVAVPFGLSIGIWMYLMTENNITIMIVALVAATIIMAMLTEIAFNFELKTAVKHWGSIIVALAISLLVLSIYKFDFFKYDGYIPTVDDVESYAVLNESEFYYTDAIDFDEDSNDTDAVYIDPFTYAKNNMFINDIDAIVNLAKKSQTLDRSEENNLVKLDIYYRLKSGVKKSRAIWVDLNDEDNDAYLNRIIGPAYYKEGIWQALTDDVPKDHVQTVGYINSFSYYDLNTNDVSAIVDLWREDMAKYDYDRVRYDNEVGYICISFDNYRNWNLPVYDCFDGIVGYLKANDRYDDLTLPIESVASVKVTEYFNAEGDETPKEPETYEYTELEQIAGYTKALQFYPIHSGWKPTNLFSYNYTVEVVLTPEYVNKYNSYSLYSFGIPNDRIDSLKFYGLLP